MPRDTQPAPISATPLDPDKQIVVCLEDFGKHGISADTYSLSRAITQAADYIQGEGGWRFLAVHYVDGDLRDAKIGAPVENFDAMVNEELAERAEQEREDQRMRSDYYASLGVRTGRPW